MSSMFVIFVSQKATHHVENHSNHRYFTSLAAGFLLRHQVEPGHPQGRADGTETGGQGAEGVRAGQDRPFQASGSQDEKNDQGGQKAGEPAQ